MIVKIHVVDADQAAADQAAVKIAAVIEALGYPRVETGTLESAREARLAELGRLLGGDQERRALRAMCCTADEHGTAGMLGVSVHTARRLERCVRTRLGVADRVELLRRVAGIEASELPEVCRAG